MIKRRLLTGILIAGLTFIGSTIVIDFTVTPVHAGLMDSLKKVGAKAKEKGQQAFAKIKGIAAGFVRIVKALNEKFKKMAYTDKVIQITAPMTIGEGEDAETKEVGFEYDFGFEGSGDIEKGYEPVVAMFAPPIEIAGMKFGLTGVQFLQITKNILGIFKNLASKIPGFPTKLVFGGMNKMLDGMKHFMRLRRETVFMLKVFLLLNAARNSQDPIKFSDIPKELTVLMARLAKTVNEKESKKRKKPVFFADTGVSDVLKDAAPGIIGKVLGSIKLDVPQYQYDEWRERKSKKEPTEMEKAYSTMRRISEYDKQTVYGLTTLLPLLDKKLDKTDEALFVKAIKVHAARRFNGMIEALGIDLLAVEGEESGSIMEGVGGDLEEQAEEAESLGAEELENKLALVKGIIKDRFPGLTLFLDKSLQKMKSKNFSKNHISFVASILAEVKSDQEKLVPLTRQIYGKPPLAEGQSLDDIGMEEDLSSLDPAGAGRFGDEDPFGPPEEAGAF